MKMKSQNPLKGKRWTGNIKILPYLIIFLICFVTINLWFISKQNPTVIIQQPIVSLSQVIALLGIVLMSFTLLLSMRLSWVEDLFGGLDKAYDTHHLLGSIAFVLLINHPLLLAIKSFPSASVSLLYLLPGTDLSYNFGIFALYTMIFSFIFMVFIKLPYHAWKMTHKVLGVTFLLGSLHTLYITSDVSSNFYLRIWIEIFIIIGVFAVFYTLFLSRFIASRFKYSVEKIERSLDIVNIYLRAATPRILSFYPGQFVYVRFANRSLGKESHPFSISSAPHDELLRLSAKAVGDYTVKLSLLGRGDNAVVDGPYGRFLFGEGLRNVVWIAGGIGVTPFLSFLASEMKDPKDRNIYFYYTYRNKEEGVFVNEINDIVLRTPHVRFFDWCTDEKKRLNLEAIGRHIDISQIDAVFLCGPLPMMKGFRAQFVKHGIPENKIFFENFSFFE